MAVLDLAMIRFFFSLAAALHQRWCRVRVTAHRGYFLNNPEQQLFITVTNLSPTREVEVVRVWITGSPTVEALSQLLPKRLKIEERWETWVPISAIGALDLPHAELRARVRLSNGKEIRSRQNTDVAPIGYVPGTSPHQ
jgi:hypothetical protein